MLRSPGLVVTAHNGSTEVCADYCEQTGHLRILLDGTLLREWFPPNSWMAIASVAGARNWGTRPDEGELRALLENEITSLRRSGA